LRWVRWLIVGCLALSAAEAIWIWPDYLAYFNLLAGGPSNGYRHLVDSSLDWGQDLKELRRWLDAHPADDGQRVYLSYFGTALPRYYKIDAVKLPGFYNFDGPQIPEMLAGGIYCISATMLQELSLYFPGRWNKDYETFYQMFSEIYATYRRANGSPEVVREIVTALGGRNINDILELYLELRLARLCAFLRQREPDANVGHSILIYKLSNEDIKRALEGPPAELLPECEADAKGILPVRLDK
jgi:hypothetical protein